MKVEIPDALKSDVPQTLFGKILSATPVVMAVVATMLAGLASSEMTRAQYDRSLGAQQQSKAGDQWGFFQAKRMRGAFQRLFWHARGAIGRDHINVRDGRPKPQSAVDARRWHTGGCVRDLCVPVRLNRGSR